MGQPSWKGRRHHQADQIGIRNNHSKHLRLQWNPPGPVSEAVPAGLHVCLGSNEERGQVTS